MSTGDQSAYLRSKIAERGLKEGAKFMKDGFDAWAESERPARVGGVEKMPAESQMTTRRVGGVRHHMKSVMGGRTPAVSSQAYMPGQYEETNGEMHGGIKAEDLVGMAQQLYDFYQNAKKFSSTVKEDLRSPDVPAKYKKTAELIADTLDKVGLGKAPHEALGECIYAHHRGRHGGASALDWIKDVGAKLVTFYNWFLKNKEGIHYVLKMKSINPPGYDYAKQFEGLLSSVGLGKKHGGRNAPSDQHDATLTVPMGGACSCVGGKKVGGRKVGGMMSAAQMAAAVKHAKEGAVSGHVSSKVAELAALEAARKVKATKKVGGRAPSARNLIVKKVMAEKSLSLIEASKYVKAHGLY